MPKLQKVRGQLDGVRGVYRLIKIGEDNVCYVGKAENIKERWYQHCKKMLGVDAAGGEWLYKCRPDQLEWTVLEVVEDGVRLDEVERYWIDFYRANEKGLNRI